MNNTLSDDEVRLEKFKCVLRTRLSAELLLDAAVEIEHLITDDLILYLKAFIWAEQLQHLEIKYPLNWKEAFKERWFPVWMLKRWPVEYRQHDINIKCLYPGYQPRIPGEEIRPGIFAQDWTWRGKDD